MQPSDLASRSATTVLLTVDKTLDALSKAQQVQRQPPGA
jgi:hypothetical protein